MAFPLIESAMFNLSFILKDKQTGDAIKDTKYSLKLSDGTVLEGVTDENGKTESILSEKSGGVDLFVEKKYFVDE